MKELEDSHLNQRIAEETSKIKVGSYQKTASLGGWAGGGRTLWAVSAVGAVAGAAMGALAPFFPVLVGASTAATAVAAMPAAIAIMAAVGLASGFSGGLILGRISGVNAAVAEESEKRMKRWTTKQLLHANPNTRIIEDEHDIKKIREYKPFWQKSKDAYATYINPRVGGFFTMVGAVGGLIMGAAFLASGGLAGAVVPAMEAVTGLSGAALSSSAIMATSVGVLASFGALFTFNLPKIVSDLTQLSGKFVSGEMLGRKWGERGKSKPNRGEAEDLIKPYSKAASTKNKEQPLTECTETDSSKSHQERYRESIEKQGNEITRS